MRFTLLLALLSMTALAQNLIINDVPAGNAATTPARARQILAAEQARPRSSGDHGFYAYHLVAHAYTYEVVRASWGSASFAPVHFVARPPLVPNERTQKFMDTLEIEKGKLMDYFGLSNQEYNKIALMALGVLGNESEFYTSWRLFVKTFLPTPALNFVRVILQRGNMSTPRSHGGIQMKEMPESVRKVFDEWAETEDLRRPEVSAVAAVIFLHNARLQIQRMARNANNTRINATNIWDFVPYLYMGSGRKIANLLAIPANRPLPTVQAQLDEIAIPKTNAYVIKLRDNMMKFLMLESNDFEAWAIP
jgi:hypothetical protein